MRTGTTQIARLDISTGAALVESEKATAGAERDRFCVFSYWKSSSILSPAAFEVLFSDHPF